MHKKNYKKHYDHLAEKYDSLWFYSENFVSFLCQNIINDLDLHPEDKFVDLGCGTGIYAKKIHEIVQFQNKVLCVDFSEEMLSGIPSNSGLKTINMDAIKFTTQAGNYDKFLIKEMIHHIDDKYALLNGVHSRLNLNGRFLLLLLPPTIDYPLFNSALKKYEKHQPHYNSILEQLSAIGFHTQVKFIDYQLEIEREKYFNMVKNRYMSILSTFSNDEIAAGLEEMKDKYSKTPILKFTDRFVSLLSIKQ